MLDKPILVTFYADPPYFTRRSVNDEYCKFFDVKPEQVIGRSCLETIPENNREQVREKIESCIQNDTVLVSVEAAIKTDDKIGVIRWVVVPVKDSMGKIIKMVAMGTPVQDRRKKEDRRKTIQKSDR